MTDNLQVKKMIRFYIVYIIFFCLFVGVTSSCNNKNALMAFKRPTYEFSVKMLDNVAVETDFHFVFSPISTWWQLMTLAEGARGKTQHELWKVTRYHRIQCFRRKYKEIINAMDKQLNKITKRSNIVIINRLLNIKKTYEKEAMKSHTTKVLSLNFDNPVDAAAKVNELIDVDMNGVISDGVSPEDFNMTLLVTTDMAYFRSNWSFAFNPIYTSTENFYKSSVPIGKVRLMTQVGYFNVTELSLINSRVVELPFNSGDRLSMLIFLPTEGYVQDLFYNLRHISLASIYNSFKNTRPQLLTVKLPRFKITTEIDNIPELLNDMGVRRIFYPDLAEFGGISNFKVHTSLMKQTADISVTEGGVNAFAEFLISSKNSETFSADRPFVYLIVDKKIDIILFAGMYTKPSIY